MRPSGPWTRVTLTMQSSSSAPNCLPTCRVGPSASGREPGGSIFGLAGWTADVSPIGAAATTAPTQVTAVNAMTIRVARVATSLSFCSIISTPPVAALAVDGMTYKAMRPKGCAFSHTLLTSLTGIGCSQLLRFVPILGRKAGFVKAKRRLTHQGNGSPAHRREIGLLGKPDYSQTRAGR